MAGGTGAGLTQFRLDAVQRLTAREREVLGLMAQGRSNAAIASSMVATDKAVGKHISNIFMKLDLPEVLDHPSTCNSRSSCGYRDGLTTGPRSPRRLDVMLIKLILVLLVLDVARRVRRLRRRLA